MDELELEVLSDEAELDLEIQTDVIAGVTKEYVDTQDAATLASAKAYTDSELEDYRTADEQALIDATKQDLITSENKLSADLVTNGLTNKVVTQAEKDSWNSKEPGDPTILKQSDVIDNVTSVLTNKPLSAKQGKDLSDRIDNISTIGRFLAIWNATTGKPTSEPEHLPYVYHTGDYFRVGTVAAQGGTNYRPNGSSYTGQASTTVYSGKLATGDLFYYDGTNWILQASSEGGKVQDVLVKSDSEYTSVVSNGNAYVDLSGKQNVISDLSTIRAGAALGDTAIQPGDNVSELENDAHYVTSENTQLTPTIPVNADTLETHPASYFATASALNTKVDKVNGKGLSSNDYTNEDKAKVQSALQSGDNVSELTNDAGYLTSHQSLSNYYTKSETNTQITNHHDTSKQDVISDLSSIRSGATLGTTSIQPNDNVSELTNDAGYLTQHQSLSEYRKASAQDLIDLGLRNDIDSIEEVIPSQATSSNQLADKNFVNSSIATNTANYISNNGQPFTSVAELEAYSGTVTNNDYAFVTGLDEHGNTYFDRYKATVTNTVTWAKEYRLNNSSFTANQWATINSGLSASDKTKLDGIEDGAEVNVLEGVQINGSDLPINNKKVEIPLASWSNLGVLKGSTNYGSYISSVGQLRGVSKTYEEYMSGNYPQMLISKGTLENVLDNETPRVDKAQSLTDIQKAQARSNIDTLGSKSSELAPAIEKNYELIEEITFTEQVSSITRTTEPNGNHYNFKKLYIYPSIVNTASYTRIDVNGVNPIAGGITTTIGNTSFFSITIENKGGITCVITSGSSSNINSPYARMSFPIFANNINSITLYRTCNVGEKILIYGIRA